MKGRIKVGATKVLILIFAVSYQITFLSSEIKTLHFVPLRHRIQFGVSSVKRYLEKVNNPYRMSPTMGNVGNIYVCPIFVAYDLTIRSKNRLPGKAFNYISLLNVSLLG